MKKVKRRNITLIEIMIVMFLIALITGVLAYNYRGSLEEGKVFKTKAAMEKLDTFLNLEVARGDLKMDEVEDRWKDVISKSPLVSNPKDLEYDGWGYEYDVHVENGKIEIRSKGLEDHNRKKGA